MAQYKKTNKKSVDSWTNITGEMRVWGNERTSANGKPFIGYSTTIGLKTDDGWDNFFVNVRFPKDNPEIVEQFSIDIKNGFLSLNVWTDKRKQKHIEPVVVVLEYELI